MDAIKQYLKINPDGFDVVFSVIENLPFQNVGRWYLHLDDLRERFGKGSLWRGELYWAGEANVVGMTTVYVGEEKAYIERLYVDLFLQKDNNLKGFSYYFLGKIREQWPQYRITFNSDRHSKPMWKHIESKGGIIRRIDSEDGEYEVLLM